MKVSLLQAATQLEAICDRIDESDEYTTALQAIFDERLTTFGAVVDKRISFLSYLQGAIAAAEEAEKAWKKRKQILKNVEARIKEFTLQTLLLEPNLKYKGELGELKVRNAGLAKMHLKGILDSIDGKFIDESDASLLKELDRYKKFLKPGFQLDRGLLKQALERGEVFDDAMIEKGKFLQVKI